MKTFAPNCSRVRKATPNLDAKTRRQAWPTGMCKAAVRSFERVQGIVRPRLNVPSPALEGKGK